MKCILFTNKWRSNSKKSTKSRESNYTKLICLIEYSSRVMTSVSKKKSALNITE